MIHQVYLRHFPHILREQNPEIDPKDKEKGLIPHDEKLSRSAVKYVVARPGLEPGTHRFSVYCSTNWAIPPLGSARIIEKKEKKQVYLKKVLIIFFSKGICDIRFSIITCKKTEYFSFWWKEFSLQGAWLEWWTFTNNSSNRKSHYSSYSKEPGTIGCFSFSSRKRWSRSGNNMH